jgi:uncharacterized protein YbjT (DUF2867 family)
VIGATGHVASYLVPRLVRAGHEVVALSRGERDPYVAAAEWRAVDRVAVDRELEDGAGVFGERGENVERSGAAGGLPWRRSHARRPPRKRARVFLRAVS